MYCSSISAFLHDPNGISIVCDVLASPPPTIEWMYRASSVFFWKTLKENTTDLHFEDPDYETEGEYQCRAKNSFGSVTSHPVSLTLLPISHSLFSYNLECTLVPNKNVSIHNSDTIGKTFIKLLKKKILLFENTKLDLVYYKSTTLGDVSVTFKISASKVDSRLNTEDHITKTLNAIFAVYKVKSNVENVIKATTETIQLTHNNIYYKVLQNSLVIEPLKFFCPKGFELKIDSIMCGKY